jgi:hypothetical protein
MNKKVKIIAAATICIVVVVAFFIIRHQIRKHLQTRRRSLSIKRRAEFDAKHSSKIAQEEKQIEPILIAQERQKQEMERSRIQQMTGKTPEKPQNKPVSPTQGKPVQTIPVQPIRTTAGSKAEQDVKPDVKKSTESQKSKQKKKKSPIVKKNTKKSVKDSPSNSEKSETELVASSSAPVNHVETPGIFGMFDIIKQILEEEKVSPTKPSPKSANTEMLAKTINDAVEDVFAFLKTDYHPAPLDEKMMVFKTL